jgi:hypothetical protein
MSYKRFLITWLDMHGRAYSRSRRISVRRMLGI